MPGPLALRGCIVPSCPIRNERDILAGLARRTMRPRSGPPSSNYYLSATASARGSKRPADMTRGARSENKSRAKIRHTKAKERQVLAGEDAHILGNLAKGNTLSSTLGWGANPCAVSRRPVFSVPDPPALSFASRRSARAALGLLPLGRTLVGRCPSRERAPGHPTLAACCAAASRQFPPTRHSIQPAVEVVRSEPQRTNPRDTQRHSSVI